MALPRARLADFALRLALVLPPLLYAAQWFAASYGRFWLPWYRFILSGALLDYRATSLSVAHRDGEWRIAGQFLATDYQNISGHLLPPGFTVNASTLLDHALIHPLILLAAVLVWPTLTWRQRLSRLLLSLPFLALLESIDIPLSLAGAVSDVVSWQASLGSAPPSAVTDWSVMLDGGGRLALGLAAALLCAVLQERLERRGRSLPKEPCRT